MAHSAVALEVARVEAEGPACWMINDWTQRSRAGTRKMVASRWCCLWKNDRRGCFAGTRRVMRCWRCAGGDFPFGDGGPV